MGTHYKGRPAEVRALDAYIKLMRAANTVATRLERPLREAGLTESQFGLLETLLHLGPVPQCTLAEKHLMSGGNITMVVDNLERRQLVTRTRDASDRRYVTVHLTPEGRRLIEKIFPVHVAAIVDELSVLEPAEQKELGRLCKKLGLRDGTVDGD